MLGYTIYIFTDNRALEYLLDHRADNTKIGRWALIIEEFAPIIMYIKGYTNVVADALSRLPLNTATTNLVTVATHYTRFDVHTFDDHSFCQQMVQAQQTDETYGPVVQYLQYGLLPNNAQEVGRVHGLSLHSYIDHDTGLLIYSDHGRNTVMVPHTMTHEVLIRAHDHRSHPGIAKTISYLSTRATWKGMSGDIRRFIHQCHVCQSSKQPERNRQGFLQSLIPNRPCQIWYIDWIVSLPLTARQHTNILTFIDPFTKWVEAFPAPTRTADIVCQHLQDDIIARFGVPDIIISDNGPEFTGNMLTRLTSSLHIMLRHSTAYHPQTQIEVERFHRTLEMMMRAYCQHRSADWDLLLHMYYLYTEHRVMFQQGWLHIK